METVQPMEATTATVETKVDWDSMPVVTGFKATDKDMRCRGFQFEIGKWHEHDGPLSMCQSGFHFCPQPSGVWDYYSGEGTRVFKVEAQGLLDHPDEPGAANKKCCRRIRLVEEVKTGGDRNTGHWNTGDWNTGDRNTGHWNTGDRNTGHWNTGDRNTGDSNTGHWNTGDRNTGDSNTGNSNTGHWNACSYSTGFFCLVDQVVCFDLPTNWTREQITGHGGYYELCDVLKNPRDDVPEATSSIRQLPNFSEEGYAKFVKRYWELSRKKQG